MEILKSRLRLILLLVGFSRSVVFCLFYSDLVLKQATL